MERHVKERLIGAAVLMAAAVILIPEMLSGPDRKVDGGVERPDTEPSLKTYTIDLQQPTPAAQAAGEERAPPPEQPEAAAEPSSSPQANPEENREAVPPTTPSIASEAAVRPSLQTPPTAGPGKSTSAADERPPAQLPQAAPGETSPSQRTAPQASAHAAEAWAVQLGSFSKQETAERLAADLRKDGHKAFVMPVRSGASTLYRVRVGPMAERAEAAAALATLKSRAAGAAIVAHP